MGISCDAILFFGFPFGEEEDTTMGKRSTRFAPAVCLTCGFRSPCGQKQHTRSARADRWGLGGGKVRCEGPWTVAGKGSK